jgi:hypothetical protein
MVVEDLNGDGKITTGVEFAFASRTAAQDSDLQALITLHDTNGDGQISALDAGFNQLQLWIDANSNGVSEAGELQTFAQAGLTSISGARRIGNYTAGDATVSAMGTAVFTANGQATTRAVADVAFAVDAQGYKVLGHNSDGTTTVQTQDGKVLLQANTLQAINATLTTSQDGALGSNQADRITATKATWINGGAGDDRLSGGAGADVLDGGAANVLDGRSEADKLQTLTITPELIAAKPIQTGAGGLFYSKYGVAANDVAWEVAA